MDKETLINKILSITNDRREDLEKKSDVDLMDYYLYLEDCGLRANFDD